MSRMNSFLRRAAQISSCGCLALWLALCGPRSAHAQFRPITFTIDANQSVVTIDGTAMIDLDGDGTTDNIPLQPQKLGPNNPENGNRDSTIADWGGTLTAILDVGNDRIQITGGSNLIPETEGLYCPGDDPPNEQCFGVEEPGQYALRLGAPGGGGSAEAAMRQMVVNMNGLSAITGGTQIDTENWHLLIDHLLADYDGTGALDELTGSGTQLVELSDTPGHNERRDDDVIAPDFSGTLTVNLPGETATIEIPLHANMLFSLEDVGVEVEVRSEFDGTLVGAGTIHAEVPLGDVNLDGVVDGLDVNILSLNFGQGEVPGPHTHDPNAEEVSEGHPLYAVWTEGDMNFDGIANQADMDIIASQFGATAGGGSAQAVPEPGSGSLAGLGTLLLVLRRKTRQTPCHP